MQIELKGEYKSMIANVAITFYVRCGLDCGMSEKEVVKKFMIEYVSDPDMLPDREIDVYNFLMEVIEKNFPVRG